MAGTDLDQRAIAIQFGISFEEFSETRLPLRLPSWNIAPSQNVLSVRSQPETGAFQLDAFKWGLVPSWAKDQKIAYKTINARVETVDTSPSYRGAFKKRRCLIVADGFYEWKRAGNAKQPYAIQRQDGSPFAFAGLWEAWRQSEETDWLLTCTIITCEPNEFMTQIHNRMPVILPEEHFQAWLSGTAGKEVLVPYPSDLISAYPISTRVNSPVNNDPDILKPV